MKRRQFLAALGLTPLVPVATNPAAADPVLIFTTIINNNTHARIDTHTEDDGAGRERVIHTISDQVTAAMNRTGPLRRR